MLVVQFLKRPPEPVRKSRGLQASESPRGTWPAFRPERIFNPATFYHRPHALTSALPYIAVT